MKLYALIIEDNNLALEALRQTIPWDELDIELVGTACNGNEGIRLIRLHRPDIILSDIHMPELDGLEMISQVQDEISASRVIFITAYQRMDYASRAIKLAAFDFILKPIDNEELTASLRRAAASIRKEREERASDEKLRQAAKRSQMLVALSRGLPGEEAAGLLQGKKAICYYILVASSKEGLSGPSIWRMEDLEAPEGVELITAVVNDELVLLCAITQEKADRQDTVRALAAQLLKDSQDMVVAVSSRHESFAQFRTAYDEARQARLFHHIYNAHAPISFFDDPHDARARSTRLQDIEQLCSKLAQQVNSLDADAVWGIVREKSGGRPRLIKTMLMFFCTRVMRDRVSSNRWEDTIDMTVYNLTRIENEADAYRWLQEFFTKVKTGSSRGTTELVSGVLEYINQHITEGLLLEDVSDQFFVSPNYLSALVRKETGITYRQHVINAKMAVAKRMLGDTRMRVEDIAHAVGYENYISFYNIFKKMEQVSPTEYRFGKRGTNP